MSYFSNKNKVILILRIISVLYILFISIFALDVFQGEIPFYKKMIGFFIHLIPSIVLAICLAVSWWDYKNSGILFIMVAVIFTFFFYIYEHISGFLLISLPPLILGSLFIWQSKKIKNLI